MATIPSRLRALLGARVEQEIYLSTADAAELTGKPSREAFIVWARRRGIPLRRPDGGRALSVKKADIDWALRTR